MIRSVRSISKLARLSCLPLVGLLVAMLCQSTNVQAAQEQQDTDVGAAAKFDRSASTMFSSLTTTNTAERERAQLVLKKQLQDHGMDAMMTRYADYLNDEEVEWLHSRTKWGWLAPSLDLDFWALHGVLIENYRIPSNKGIPWSEIKWRSNGVLIQYEFNPNRPLKPKVSVTTLLFPQVPNAVAQLKDSRVVERNGLVVDSVSRLATKALVETELSVWAPLVAFMKISNSIQIGKIVEILEQRDDREAIPALIDALKYMQTYIDYSQLPVASLLSKWDAIPSGGEDLAWYALARRDWSLLEQLGATALQPLIYRLSNTKNDELQSKIPPLLGKIGTPDVVKILTEGLASKDINLSFGSINGLLEVGDRQASDILIRFIKHKDWNRVDRIVKGLIKVGEPALPAVFDALPSATTTQRKALSRIVVGMGEITHARLLEGLMSEDYRTRMFSINALNEMNAWIPPGSSLTAYFLARREWSKLTSEEIAIFEAQGAVSAGPLLASLRRDGGASQAQAAKLLKQLKMQPQEGTDLVWYLIAQGKWRRVQRMGAISIPPLTHIVDNLGHPKSGHKWVGSLSKMEQGVHTKKHQAAMRVLSKLKASKS